MNHRTSQDEIGARVRAVTDQLVANIPDWSDLPVNEERMGMFVTPRATRRHRRPVIAAACLVLAVGATGILYAIRGGGSETGQVPATQAPVQTSAVRPANTTESATIVATVIGQAGQPARVCGNVNNSLPPTCDGIDIASWTWEDLPHRTEQQTRWGTFVFTGYVDLDAVIFHLVGDVRVATDQDVPDFSPPAPTNLTRDELRDIKAEIGLSDPLIAGVGIGRGIVVVNLVVPNATYSDELRSRYGDAVYVATPQLDDE